MAASTTTTLLDAIKNRGSLHVLSDNISVFDARIQEIVQEGILHAPSPFNCQAGRAVVLVKEEHKKFWDLAYDAAKASVPTPAFEKGFEPRIKMFRAAYGTVSSRFFPAQRSCPIVYSRLTDWHGVPDPVLREPGRPR
jgi:predicted oxidoreductase (fatty acid repression mutant protein)